MKRLDYTPRTFVALSFLTLATIGQADTGSIKGLVKDVITGRKLALAQIILVQDSIHLDTITTGQHCVFISNQIEAGIYSVVIERKGFKLRFLVN